MNLRSQQAFFSQLTLLIRTGTGLTKALELIAESGEPEVAETSTKLLRALEQGKPLSKSFGDAFGPVIGGLLGIAQRTGSLVRTLESVAQRSTHQIRRQDEVRAAIMYPMGVLVLSLLTGATIIVLLLPQLLPFITSLGVPLPWPTRVLVVLNEWRWVWANLIFLPLSVVAITMRTSPESAARIKDYLREHTPHLSTIIRELDLAHACQELRLCIQAGLGFHEALRLLSQTSPSPSLKGAFKRLSEAVYEGDALEDYFVREPELGKMFATSVILGQESGKLPAMLACGARILQEDAEFQLRRFIDLIEPIAMACISITVGFIAVAGLMPIYQVVTAPI